MNQRQLSCISGNDETDLQQFLSLQDYFAAQRERLDIQRILADDHVHDINELFAEAAAESNGPDSYDDGDY